MANTVMTGIYNHYLTAYAPKKSDARLDSHDRNKLKTVYSNIQKMNKESPLYILDRSMEAKSFAISLKESARQLQHALLQTAGNTENDFLKNQIAYSSNENILSAEYIGNASNPEEIPTYEIEVQSLASPQVNVGNFLPEDELYIEPGNYSFDVNINGMGYEFQYSIYEDDTNRDIQDKLLRLINQSNIGLHASIMEGPENTSSLRITSTKTGEGSVPGAPLFTISDDQTSKQSGSVDYLGIQYMATAPADAKLTINGTETTASSNHFTIDKNYEVTLNNLPTTAGETVTIGVKPNTESLKDNIRSLIGGFNTFLQSVDEFTKSATNSSLLSNEIQGIAKLYTNELDAIGINATDDGTLTIDENLLSQAAISDNALDLLSPLKSFSSSLYQRSEKISLDPLNYANKTIVAYKNPGKSFPCPYISSNYSGLLFNYYC